MTESHAPGEMPLPESIGWDELDGTKYIMYGSVYIVGVSALLYPADLIKTRLQADKYTDQKGIKLRKVAAEILKREGIRGMYRGFAPATIGNFPGQAIYYATYEWVAQTVNQMMPEDASKKYSFVAPCVAGFMAEFTAALTYVPSDIISQRLQVQSSFSFTFSRFRYRSSWDVAKTIYQTEGIRGFYRSLGVYNMTYGPSSAVWWSSYEFSKNFIHNTFNWTERMIHQFRTTSLPERAPEPLHATEQLANSIRTPTTGIPVPPHYNASDNTNSAMTPFRIPAREVINHFLSGAFAGVCAVLVTNPLDVARTRLQLLEARSDTERASLKAGYFQILRKVYEKEGWRGFYKGVKPRVYVSIPGSALAFIGYEALKQESRKDTSV